MMIYQSETTKKYSKKPVIVQYSYGQYIIKSHNGKVLFWSVEKTAQEAIQAFEQIKPLGFWSQSIYNLALKSNEPEEAFID